MSDRAPLFLLERQQRSFKSDSGLGSELEIGRRNSRGPARSRVPYRAREWCTCRGSTVLWMGTTRGSNALPRYAVYRFREAVRWIRKEKKKEEEERERELPSVPRGGEEKKREEPRRWWERVSARGRKGDVYMGWTGAKKKEKNKKRKRKEERGGWRERRDRRRKKKRWNSVVYPVIYNWKLGNYYAARDLRRYVDFTQGSPSPPSSPPSSPWLAQFAEGHSTFDRNRCSPRCDSFLCFLLRAVLHSRDADDFLYVCSASFGSLS